MTGAETIVCELTEPAQYARLLDRSRIVVHLASRSTPGSSAGKSVDELLGNMLPLAIMLEALQQAPHVNLLYLSSGVSLYSMHTNTLAMEPAEIQPRSYQRGCQVHRRTVHKRMVLSMRRQCHRRASFQHPWSGSG